MKRNITIQNLLKYGKETGSKGNYDNSFATHSLTRKIPFEKVISFSCFSY